MTITDYRRPGLAEGASTVDLVRRATEQTSVLARDEVALAKAELTEKARRAGAGAGLLGAAGITALYGVAALLATAIVALALAMPDWLAALIVTVALFVAAGILAIVGRIRVRSAGPATPEQTVHSVETDMRTVADAVRRGRVRR